MKADTLRRFLDLHYSLTRERAELERRLAQVNQALGDVNAVANTAAASPISPENPAGNLSLREAVLQALARGPMTKQEILKAIQAGGYKFSTKDPMNSLGTILYGKNPKFRNEGGTFSLAGAPVSAAAASSGGPFQRARRALSTEARERIAAAQRARWAAQKRKR